jgi:hypothetical protein
VNSWIADALNRLAKQPVCGYYVGQRPASEPTALAAWALTVHGLASQAALALDYLASLQAADGSVGIRSGETQPGWPTALALLAWQSAGNNRYARHLRQGANWLLNMRSVAAPRSPYIAHDTTLLAWPWAAGTHAWVEPTAQAVLALKAVGQTEHARTREAVRVLIDRQIPGGGCNYGNTVCLGQKLRPHVQPTGAALAALAGEHAAEPRIALSTVWLARSLSAQTATSSLCWGLLGLAAQSALSSDAPSWLEAACQRTLRNDCAPYKLALLALAASKVES